MAASIRICSRRRVTNCISATRTRSSSSGTAFTSGRNGASGRRFAGSIRCAAISCPQRLICTSRSSSMDSSYGRATSSSRLSGGKNPIRRSRNTSTTPGLISRNFPLGQHELVYRAVNVRGDAREGIDWRRERIIIAEPLPADTFVDSDGVIPPLDKNSPLSVVEQINARPSIVHRASTHSFPGKIKNVAVIRPDQLGDLVGSVPALLRLREILPEARLVGLLGPANAPLAKSLGIFDEIVLLDFPDDPHQRQRIMDRKGQAELAGQAGALQIRRRDLFPRRRLGQNPAPDGRSDRDRPRGRSDVAQSGSVHPGPKGRERDDVNLGQDARAGRGPRLVAGQRR